VLPLSWKDQESSFSSGNRNYIEHTVIEKPKNGDPGDTFNIRFNWILNDSNNNSNIVVTLEDLT
jgi:hypothetical protein